MTNIFRVYLLKNRKGSALAMVLIVFLIISILLSSMVILFRANLKEATYQEDKMKAHYLALSGIDIARSTLLKPITIMDGKEISMIEYIKSNQDSEDLHMEDSSLELDGKTIEIHFEYDHIKKIAAITSRVKYNEQISSELKLKMDVKTKKYTEFWE